MEQTCVHERRKCVNHGPDTVDWPLIEIIHPEDSLTRNVTHLMVVYVLRGSTDAAFETETRYPLAEGDLMLFPPGTRIALTSAAADTSLVLMKVVNRVVLCDKYVFGRIWENIDTDGLRHRHLAANRTVRAYMELLAETVGGPLRCYRFMEIKILELFHYLRAYYRPDELAAFTQPLMSPNARFMYFIWNNYRAVRSVEQFAGLANCSMSAFQVRFRHVTGMSPSQWLNEQKARNVFHELSAGEKSLKEISDEYHFASVSHLGTFCRRYFGQTPGELRPGTWRGGRKTD